MPFEEMEEVLKFIHKHFATPHANSCVARSESEKILNQIVGIMREEDSAFKDLYEKYNLVDRSLQVKKPFDFDVKFVFTLPKCQLEENNLVPGYMKFKIKDDYRNSVYQKFCANGHLQTNLVFNWMKSLIYRALNNIRKEGTISNFYLTDADNSEIVFYTEHGSNLVICIYPISGDPIYLHITAAFEFGKAFWPRPEYGYKPNPTNKLMKANLKHKVSNYGLKTLILAEAEVSANDWKKKSLSETFMLVLDNYIDGLGNSHIPYFWKTRANLIKDLNEGTRINHYYELRRLRRRINADYEYDPTVVAKIILKGDDYNRFLELWEERWSDDFDDWSKSLGNLTLNDDALKAAAVVTGVVGACALGAVLWDHFSNRPNS